MARKYDYPISHAIQANLREVYQENGIATDALADDPEWLLGFTQECNRRFGYSYTTRIMRYHLIAERKSPIYGGWGKLEIKRDCPKFLPLAPQGA